MSQRASDISIEQDTDRLSPPATAHRYSGTAPRTSATITRSPRKIRFTDAEWALVVSRARECAKPPARYVREVALGAVPKARRSHSNAELIRDLGRIGNTLARLASAPPVTPRDNSDPTASDLLNATLTELLAAVRRIG